MKFTIEYRMLDEWSHNTGLLWITFLRAAGFIFDPATPRKVNRETLEVTVVMVAPEVEKVNR